MRNGEECSHFLELSSNPEAGDDIGAYLSVSVRSTISEWNDDYMNRILWYNSTGKKQIRTQSLSDGLLNPHLFFKPIWTSLRSHRTLFLKNATFFPSFLSVIGRTINSSSTYLASCMCLPSYLISPHPNPTPSTTTHLQPQTPTNPNNSKKPTSNKNKSACKNSTCQIQTIDSTSSSRPYHSSWDRGIESILSIKGYLYLTWKGSRLLLLFKDLSAIDMELNWVRWGLRFIYIYMFSIGIVFWLLFKSTFSYNCC